MSRLNKLWKFLASMKFAILLLLLLIAACALGSFVPQGKTLDWYLQNYPERTAALIVGTRFDDVFHSPWFLVLTVFLCCNLMLCNLFRLPQLIRRYKNAANPKQIAESRPTVTLEGIRDPDKVFAALHMPAPVQTELEGNSLRYCVKNRIGLWGPWITHLGILLLILGFALGQMTKTEYAVYGVPGQTKPVGETGYTLTFNSFEAEWNESGTPIQFSSDVTMRDPAGAESSARVQVNEPGRLFGYKVYQNSTGSAARITVRINGEVVQDEVLCKGDYLVIQNTPVAVFFEGYEAEAEFDDGIRRPVYDYVLYDTSQKTQSLAKYQLEGEVAVETAVYSVQFSEHQDYTLLQLKQDRFTGLVLAGGIITMLGLILAFYLQHRTLWAKRQADGVWTVFASCRKGGALFAEQVRRAAGETACEPVPPEGPSDPE